MNTQKEKCEHGTPLTIKCLQCYRLHVRRKAAFERVKKQAKNLDW